MFYIHTLYTDKVVQNCVQANVVSEKQVSYKTSIETELLGKISFLDILIRKTPSSIVTTVYRKPTHSGVFTHYTSYVPFKYKRNLIWGLLDRAYKLCSTWECLAREHDNLCNMLMNCGYNKSFILRMIGQYMNSKFRSSSNYTVSYDILLYLYILSVTSQHIHSAYFK